MTLLDMMILTEQKLKIDAHDKFIKCMNPLDDRLDKEALASFMVRECGPMTPVFQDVWGFWKYNADWYKINADPINKLVETLYYNYSPLHNYDMEENIKSEGTSHNEGVQESNGENSQDTTQSSQKDYKSTEKEKFGGTDNLQHNYNSDINDDGGGSDNNTNTRDLQHTSSILAFTENKVSAYNEDLYQPDKTEQTVTHAVEKDTGTVIDDGGFKRNNKRERRGNDTDITTYGKTRQTDTLDDVTTIGEEEHTEGTDTNVTTHENDGKTTGKNDRKAFGNTGIYSKQQLIQQQRDIDKFNIYDYIVYKWKKDLFYLVY